MTFLVRNSLCIGGKKVTHPHFRLNFLTSVFQVSNSFLNNQSNKTNQTSRGQTYPLFMFVIFQGSTSCVRYLPQQSIKKGAFNAYRTVGAYYLFHPNFRVFNHSTINRTMKGTRKCTCKLIAAQANDRTCFSLTPLRFIFCKARGKLPCFANLLFYLGIFAHNFSSMRFLDWGIPL